ncbi:MAG: YHS domain-containing protein [Candidatus Aminicenantes bacterium]|nr:YHS domain-containing protein [Candidatus Aminicenantes bacterium]
MSRSYWIAFVGLFVLALVLAAPAAQETDIKVVDPVCGMSILKSQAKATFEYKGETYYFCSTGCKDRFAKEPETYLAKVKVAQAGAPAEKGEPMPMPQAGMGMRHGQTPQPPAGSTMMPGGQHAMGGMMHGRAMMARRMAMGMMMRHGHGMMMAGPMMCGCGSASCPMMAEGVERKVEKTADGVVIKITAKDPELVKKIQAHVDRMAAPAASAGSCPPDCPMKKAETPKEVKK